MKVYEDQSEGRIAIQSILGPCRAVAFTADLDDLEDWCLDKIAETYLGKRSLEEVLSGGKGTYKKWKEGELPLLYLGLLEEVKKYRAKKSK